MTSDYIHKTISFAGIPFYTTISWIIFHKDISVFIQQLYPFISQYIYLFPNCYPGKIFLIISNSDIPDYNNNNHYIQRTYPRPMSDKNILRLFIDILSYIHPIYPGNISICKSTNNVHAGIHERYPCETS
jgi:hypothetical protein